MSDMNNSEQTPKHHKLTDIQREIARTHEIVTMETPPGHDAMQKASDEAYEMLAFWRESMNVGLARIYAKMTLQEKITATRLLLNNKQAELEAIQKIVLALNEKLNELKMSAQ